MHIQFLILFISIFILMGCEVEKKPDGFQYIHIAHTRIRDTINQKLDPRVEQIDFNKFDMVLLGGDLTEDTSEEFETLEYLDGILDLSNQNVLWSMGNHDNTNLDLVERITKRPIYYSNHKNGITYIVLNSHGELDWQCDISDPQLELINNVTDTISESSHLVVMTHKLLWLLGHPEMEEHVGKKGYFSWTCNYGVVPNNWNKEVLPKLRMVQKKGVQVICLAGDIGNAAKEFEEHTTDGLIYLASGINPVDKDVKFLYFKHDPPELKWEFVEVEKYLAAGQVWKIKGELETEK